MILTIGLSGQKKRSPGKRIESIRKIKYSKKSVNIKNEHSFMKFNGTFLSPIQLLLYPKIDGKNYPNELLITVEP